MPIGWPELTARCERAGIPLRGGFHPGEGDGVPAAGALPAGTLVLLGNAGPSMWRAFSRAREGAPDLALDDWTRTVVSALAAELGATAIFPFTGPPYWPFQRWAQRAEAVYPSPLGILIHPRFGLWHGYRAALVFAERLSLPPREDLPSPCASCVERPCLRACPVSAFSPSGYDVKACIGHLDADPAAECMTRGCQSRRACPVGQEDIYLEEQRRFHMRAFRNAAPPERGRE
ncbi:hypothetical protein SOCEGT47_051780 [Sorangium cellulosum]|jgi:hypothetical protein|uniref:4Fe-4S ferredoxin-type domain-containing protein n=1 Tax=Sorangium cellulosum TaxID=56 RepID=A0A4P2Q5I8_SORCE|nr:hypothetical protein [Sorangium cellulosum]AUX24639.1 hypothetical protein SOCEGT47_051780 [Sorangium cellulosum]